MELNKSHSIICSYIYNDTIERVYDCYRTPECLNSVLKVKADSIECKGGDYGKVGNKIVLGWKNVFIVEFEVIEVVDNETYKMLKFYTNKVEPYDLKYTLTFHFYSNMIENTTLFVHEMSFDNPQALETLDLNHDKKEKMEIFQGIENILNQLPNDLYQFESTTIEAKIDTVWKAISDWKVLNYYVDFIAESLTYKYLPGSSSCVEIGTKIYIKDTFMGLKYYLKVIKVENNSEKKKIVFECKKSNPPCPLQHLEFVLHEVHFGMIMLEFKHIFKERISLSQISKLKEIKLKILTKLKTEIENERK
jgi:hypothetical protein